MCVKLGHAKFQPSSARETFEWMGKNLLYLGNSERYNQG